MITKFVDREVDLEALHRKFRNKGFEFIPIYGRRRVGKTELILQFIKNRKSIYFLATSGTKKENIVKFKSAAKKIVDLDSVKDEWEAIFKHVKENVKARVVVVIDEFPYLLETEQGLSSIFQRIVDLHLKDSNIFLILCGSSLSMMYKQVLAYKAPLYGRRTGQLKISPLRFRDAIQFFDRPFEEAIKAYSVCGGVPAYIREFTGKKPVLDLIAEKVLVRGSLLREEVPFLLREEFRDPRVYLSIMSAMALGYRKLGEIINYCGIRDKTSITPYLHNLESLDYIRRELPVTETPRSKKGLYFINDLFFNFWFRIVRKNFDVIEKDIELALENVKKEFNGHVSFVFEDVCKQFLWDAKQLNFEKSGRWWHKDREIDIVALNEKTREILLCECKWQSAVDAGRVVEKLAEKAENVEWRNTDRDESYAVFAKTFAKKMDSYDGKPVYCFDLMDLEETFRRP